MKSKQKHKSLMLFIMLSLICLSFAYSSAGTTYQAYDDARRIIRTERPIFNDVLSSHWAWWFIRTIYNNALTGGCGGNNFCPENPVTRGEMAVFIETALGVNTPPPCIGSVFTDVTAASVGAAFCGYIEKFAADGITAGCGGGYYCPNDYVTRAQMAVFIEAAIGATSAPACTEAVFNDVTAASLGSTFCGFIEDFARRGITTGCGGGNYCPNDPVTRAQMAVFLTQAFTLQPDRGDISFAQANTQPGPYHISISVSPSSYSFGSVKTGTSSPAQTITISNTGTANFKLFSLSLTGSSVSEFRIGSDGCSGKTIAPQSNCTAQVTFNPATVGAKSAILNIAYNDDIKYAYKVSLSGTGVTPKISVAPAPVDFGSVKIGAASPARTVTISNVGTGKLMIGTISLKSTNLSMIISDYRISSNGCDGQTIVPSGSCTIQVTFSRSISGATGASLIIPSDDPSAASLFVPLSGTGINPQLTVTKAGTGGGNSDKHPCRDKLRRHMLSIVQLRLVCYPFSIALCEFHVYRLVRRGL